MEAKRLLDVLNKQLDRGEFVAGDFYSVADIAIYPWVLCLDKFYNGEESLGLSSYKNVARWREAVGSRPAVIRGLGINGFTPETKNFHTSGKKDE
jgi:GSH-dependent disulfide-bond oxidoreductase